MQHDGPHPKELEDAQAEIQNLHQSHAVTDELQHLLQAARTCISQADTTHHQSSVDLAMLRQDLTDLRGDCDHASAESNKQFQAII